MKNYHLWFGISILLLAGGWITIGDKKIQNKPNVLLIISDDLNDAVEGMGGHSQAYTPNIDKFMEISVTFSNAHANNPICAPSRASFLTGIYPHNSGYYGYRQDINKWYNNPILKKAVTIFEYFSNNGYDVYGTGKLFHHRLREVLIREDGFNGNSPLSRDVGPFAYNGKNFVGHPSSPDALKVGKWPEYVSFASLAEIPDIPANAQTNIPGYKGWVNRDKTPFHYTDENNRDLMTDEKHAQWVADLLKQKHENPFFITVGFHKPHSPWYAPEKYFEMHPLEEIKLPPYLENDLEDCANILEKDSFKAFQIATNRFKRMKNAYDEKKLELEWKRWIQAYLACVSFVDEQIGAILQALEKSPYAENTIVVITSDHGFHMGEKDRLWKHTMWEESTRIPLIFKSPGITVANSVCSQPVSLIDLYPTLVDLCGLRENPQQQKMQFLDGYSLKPLLQNPEKNRWQGPEVVLSCINGLKNPGLDHPAKIENQHFSVRSKQYRYTLCSNGEEELYDHKVDPNEWNNLSAKKNYQKVKIQLKKQMNNILFKKSELKH